MSHLNHTVNLKNNTALVIMARCQIGPVRILLIHAQRILLFLVGQLLMAAQFKRNFSNLLMFPSVIFVNLKFVEKLVLMETLLLGLEVFQMKPVFLILPWIVEI